MQYDFNQALKDRVKCELDGFERRRITGGNLLPAAVAIVLVPSEQGNEACFVLTRRPKTLRRHSGQFALPGGRVDEGEEIADTVMREIWEEIGVDASRTDILGWLDDFQTRSGFRVSPAIVWAGAAREIRPDPEEVESVFRIPLWDLDRPEIPRLRHKHGVDQPVLSAPFETLGHEVYAPTAAILYQFREVGLNGRETRVAHFEQPRFAWK
jgi:8-oxo-dGTP pyrophosphatase MutT (NUDIX family)